MLQMKFAVWLCVWVWSEIGGGLVYDLFVLTLLNTFVAEQFFSNGCFA